MVSFSSARFLIARFSNTVFEERSRSGFADFATTTLVGAVFQAFGEGVLGSLAAGLRLASFVDTGLKDLLSTQFAALVAGRPRFFALFQAVAQSAKGSFFTFCFATAALDTFVEVDAGA